MYTNTSVLFTPQYLLLSLSLSYDPPENPSFAFVPSSIIILV
jgi:hypothetical protein